MKAFFDTNVYIDFLGGALTREAKDEFFSRYVVRVCPVVYHELIRGIRSEKILRKMEKAMEQVRFLPPPTTAMWIKAGLLAPRVMKNHAEPGLAKIQNDLLIALSSRENGVLLITRDRHFNRIREHLFFQYQIF